MDFFGSSIFAPERLLNFLKSSKTMLIVLSPQCTADPKNMTEIIIFIALIMLSIYINILALKTSRNIDLNYGCFDKKKRLHGWIKALYSHSDFVFSVFLIKFWISILLSKLLNETFLHSSLKPQMGPWRPQLWLRKIRWKRSTPNTWAIRLSLTRSKWIMDEFLAFLA